MVIILPPFEDGSLAETVSRMTPENVQGVMAEIKSGFYKADDLKIQIPKFVIEQVCKLVLLTIETFLGKTSYINDKW